ncbi:flavin-containing monooxygenase [Actinomadura sp. HBU206391]|uniref:flavin-containing monooxygenase n=1 Tax=Actinomadura sp. HBU206391 TaxID=2731692 RepID=UPI00164FD440|nr:NAD(P)/FAD-dependent oxidoreductase [Actinomadura sp. HBU206391]MBC6460068.1 NAD(P)/FAD-dependent oxidoreductase [Actinomadura sp. HBU206391]
MGDDPSIVIVGSGFAGLGMAIQLKKAGFHDFVILEKNADVGGTWRDNTYPGCACDVPSHMYSFSFELNPGWSRMFAPQEEIWAYMRRCVAKHGLAEHLRYGSAVDAMEWDDSAGHWEVTVADGSRYTPKAVIAGIGGLHIPSYPDIPGLERFAGAAFHSAEWDHSLDLEGKRVAVIGTGASAIQFVPPLAEKAARLHVFQRTAPWIQPRPDIRFSTPMRRALALPGAARAFRTAIYWVLEARSVGFTVDPRLSGAMKKVALDHLARQIRDPELRAKVTPDYTIGCKRILLSSDYYPALTRPNVDLVTDEIAEVTETGIVTASGSVHEVDVIVYGTGFKVADALTGQRITGRNGLKIQEAWADGIEAHHGVTVPGFPNLFLLSGPNTGLGHNSIIFMIETQIQHILGCLRLLSAAKGRAIEVRGPAVRRFNDRVQRRLRRAVWSQGGCRSWYLDENGVNRTLWPGFSFEYWAGTRRPDPADYTVTR